ncbi:MAG: divergent polysaccharide deacetylase family protein [Acidiferrobacterales bacterium]
MTNESGAQEDNDKPVTFLRAALRPAVWFRPIAVILRRGIAPWIQATLTAVALLGVSGAYGADTPHFPPTYISIIIDDLGNSLPAGEQAVHLPGPVACAILPHTPYAVDLDEMAHRHGKEVLLHLPMEPVGGLDPGPGALDTAMSRTLLTLTLDNDLSGLPYLEGVNNHMGSLLTSRPVPMAWIMQALHEHGGLFFVDSRTIAQTVAARTAGAYRIPNLSRNVFLDDIPTVDAVERQFALLIRVARRRGHAVAIGHPRPATLEVLRQWLPRLGFYRIRLVPLATLLALKRGETLPWQLPGAQPPPAILAQPEQLPEQDDPSIAWP